MAHQSLLENNWLCLNFVNSVDLRLSVRDESLHSYKDVVAWGRQQGVITDAETALLLDKATARPGEAIAAYRLAIALREVLYRIFSAVIHEKQVPAADLTAFNAVLAEEAAPTQLIQTEGGLTCRWLDRKGELGWPLAPIARSAVALLTSESLDRLRECPGSPGRACGWLFVDMTKNRSRQWCVGGLCGNRTRALRHYERGRKQAAVDSP